MMMFIELWILNRKQSQGAHDLKYVNKDNIYLLKHLVWFVNEFNDEVCFALLSSVL